MSSGQVVALWRYPVKSLGGEPVERIDIGRRGLLGDRLWAVRDVERDVTASARRIPKLLTATARYVAPVPPDAGPGNVPDVEITFPDGEVVSSRDDAVHERLSTLVDRDVRLTSLPPADDTSLHKLNRDERENMSIAALRKDFGVSDEEKFPDLSVFRVADLAKLARYSTPPGMFVDLAPVHVLTETSLATVGAEVDGSALDVRRFRPNILLALTESGGGLPESEWIGGRLSVGGVGLEVAIPTIRCVVPSRAQPGLDVDRRITKAVAERANRCLGAYCWVESGGAVTVGDEFALAEPKLRAVADAARRTKRFAFGLATSAMERFSR